MKRLLCSILFATLSCALLPGQDDQAAPQTRGDSREADRVPRFAPDEAAVPQPGTGDPDIDALTPVWSRPVLQRPFQGFPVFPSRLPGYGRYPRSLSELIEQPPQAFGEPLVGVAMPLSKGWPSWLKLQSRMPLPYQFDRALLVQSASRVWWRDVDEEAFVPLYTYDKLRVLQAGVDVEVRQTGEFELLMHDGGRIVAQGPTALRIDSLGAEIVELTLQQLASIRLDALQREYRITLPDGSLLTVPPRADSEGMMAEDWRQALVVIERVDEPGWRSGRATLWNGGEVAVGWRHAHGEVQIESGQRVTLMLTPAHNRFAAELRSEVLPLVHDGGKVRALAAVDGQISWSGARFTVPQGAELVFDSQQGTLFEVVIDEAKSE